MKRIRLDRWSSQLQPPRNPRIQSSQQSFPYSTQTTHSPRRQLHPHYDRFHYPFQCQRRHAGSRRKASSAAAVLVEDEDSIPPPAPAGTLPQRPTLNFPSHRKALRSSKLSALHARLSLPAKLPLQTLARCLIDASVDSRPGYNNEPLAIIGQDLLGYYTAEWLLCHYPRLPMPIIFAAQHAYVGAATLASMRAEWGVEVVAAPGPEVDAGLLQLKRMPAGNAMAQGEMRRVKDLPDSGVPKLGTRNDVPNYRRGMSSRIVYDDQFGDLHAFNTADTPPFVGAPISKSAAANPSTIADAVENPLEPTTSTLTPPELDTGVTEETDADSTPNFVPSISTPRETQPITLEAASATFIRALCGALYLHAGTPAAKTFHTQHILSRHLPLHGLFHFSHPTRDLSRLCDREGFEPPVARLISETGRHSRTPVFVVGVFSGDDKLGEGAGSSLNEGRVRAAAAALRSWYLYSPAEGDVVVPSDVEGGVKGKKWKAQMVDMGEIVT